MPAKMPGVAPLVEAPKSPPTNAPAFPMRAKAIPTIPVIFRALLTSFAGYLAFVSSATLARTIAFPLFVMEKETTSKPLPVISFADRSIKAAILLV